MTYKTSELEGELLNKAVYLALGLKPGLSRGEMVKPQTYYVPFDTGPSESDMGDDFEPSTLWQHGGPIIEQESIGIADRVDCWIAGKLTTSAEPPVSALGPTPLIAAMRCFVAAKLGDEVELP